MFILQYVISLIQILPPHQIGEIRKDLMGHPPACLALAEGIRNPGKPKRRSRWGGPFRFNHVLSTASHSY